MPVTLTNPQQLLNSSYQTQPSYLLAVLPLQVKVVGGIHSSVHALFVSGDPAFHSDPLRRGSQRKLL